MFHYHDQVFSQGSIPAAGAQVSVLVAGTATLATVYADNGGTTKSNPMTTDSQGLYDFYVADGRYDINISGANVIPKTLSDIPIFDQQQGTSGVVVNAAEFTGADACAKINAAIAALPATGGVVDARSFGGVQVCNTAISYTGNTKSVQIWQGASTLQFSSAVTSPAVFLTGAGSMWTGIGPEANTTGASVLQAGPGFTGILVKLGSPSGDTNLKLYQVKVDGNGQAGVTGGVFLNTSQNINWTLLDEVSIINVTAGSGLIYGSGVQSIRTRNLFQRNNATCMDMSAGASAGATGGFWNDNPRLLCNGYVYLIGSDDALSANTIQGIWQTGGDIGTTSAADGTKPMILVRNARDIQISNAWWETSAVQSGISTAMVQLGTANTVGLPPAGFRTSDGHINGNNKASYFIDIENASNVNLDLPSALSLRNCYVLNNGGTDILIKTPATNGGSNLDSTCLTVSTSNANFRAGSFGGSPFSMLAPSVFIGVTGTTFMTGKLTGDTDMRVALQDHGVVRFGNGTGTNDLGLSRSAANTLAVGTGAQGNTAGTVAATTLAISATAFASLGTPANGTFVYCNDCTVANPCNSGGTGALAKRLNGSWVCN